MAEIKIILDLSNEDDLRDYNLFNNASNLNSSLFDITNNLKKEIRWLIEDKDISNYDVLEITFKRIFEIIEENNINPENLL